jgi:hypothetical protein
MIETALADGREFSSATDLLAAVYNTEAKSADSKGTTKTRKKKD